MIRLFGSMEGTNVQALFYLGFCIGVIAILGLSLMYCLYQLHQYKQRCVATDSQLVDAAAKQQVLQATLIELQDKVRSNELVDALTGLPSRKVFEDRLTLTINQSARYKLTCSVMFLNLDGFKVINDALGHDAGDELLKEVGARLATCVRQVDTVGRFGGDEFVFIFSQIAKAETAAYIVQRLLGVILQPFQIQNQTIYMTASVGIAVFPMDGQDAKTLIKNADNALHQAKVRGRNMYQFYREEMNAQSRRELLLDSALHNESLYENFVLQYQPQVNIKTKKVVCMDAFLQWNHPDFGMIAFSEFMKLAENSGRMIEIGEWMLRSVGEHLATWRKHEFFPLAISVPLSFKQLENTHFIHKVSAMLQEIKLDPECLVYEIRDASLLTKIDVIEKMLYRMKHLGVRIAINHFGAGNLSLEHLRRLPIDIFKIDGLLVKDMTVNKESEAIVKMVIALAKSLQAGVVAEGVESLKQKMLLTELECSVMQGPLFSRPSLASEFTLSRVQRIYENV